MKILMQSDVRAAFGNDGIARTGYVYDVPDKSALCLIGEQRAVAVAADAPTGSPEDQAKAREAVEAAKKPTKEEAAATAKQEKQDAKDEAKEEADAKKEAAHHKHDKH